MPINTGERISKEVLDRGTKIGLSVICKYRLERLMSPKALLSCNATEVVRFVPARSTNPVDAAHSTRPSLRTSLSQ